MLVGLAVFDNPQSGVGLGTTMLTIGDVVVTGLAVSECVVIVPVLGMVPTRVPVTRATTTNSKVLLSGHGAAVVPMVTDTVCPEMLLLSGRVVVGSTTSTGTRPGSSTSLNLPTPQSLVFDEQLRVIR
jgi:hypothetical protein